MGYFKPKSLFEHMKSKSFGREACNILNNSKTSRDENPVERLPTKNSLLKLVINILTYAIHGMSTFHYLHSHDWHQQSI